MRGVILVPQEMTALVNGVPVTHIAKVGKAAIAELTEKQIIDAKAAGNMVFVEPDPNEKPQMPLETVTVLKADLAVALKTVVPDADKKSAEELKEAVEVCAKAEPIEEVKP